ncbi:hypothetical protein SDJN03_23009, partial [Cucurbita argyrosperma subsp. sororia]
MELCGLGFLEVANKWRRRRRIRRQKPEAERFPLELGVAWYSTGREASSFLLPRACFWCRVAKHQSGLRVDAGFGTAAAKNGFYVRLSSDYCTG